MVAKLPISRFLQHYLSGWEVAELSTSVGMEWGQFIGYACLDRSISSRNTDELPHCSSASTTRLARKTSLGYPIFRCRDCSRQSNERTGTPYNFLEFPTDIVLLVVLWRLRYKLGLRDLSEIFLVRGFEFTHEAVRDWEARFAPLITERLRSRRRGKAAVVVYR